MIDITEIINTIIQGDALSILKQFPDECVDCVICSPPYYTLRKYDVPDIIFDANDECEHEFIRSEKLLHSGRGDAQKSKKYSQQGDIPDVPVESQFCKKCGAWKGQLGLEPSPELYIKHLCDIFSEVFRVLKKSGSCWVNISDSYAGSGCGTNDYRTEASKSISGKNFDYNKLIQAKQPKLKIKSKSLIGIPEMFVLEMQKRGWIRRNTIIWHKNNCMPESVKDRFTRDFEYFYFFTKNRKYYFEQQFEEYANSTIPRILRGVSNKHKWTDGAKGQTPQPINKQRKKRQKGSSEYYDSEGNLICNPKGRNMRCVWTISTKPLKFTHYAAYPIELCTTPIKACCPEDGIVLDPFAGAGNTILAAIQLNRNFIGIELSETYIENIAKKRLLPVLKKKTIIS